MNFTIGSSFFDKGRSGEDFRRSFAHLWYFNTMAMKPKHVIVVSEGGSKRPQYTGVDVLNLTGDLGHCEDLVYNRKPHEFSSWSISMCLTALAAYDNETDYLYKEEDALGFGPIAERMYADLGSGMMVFGRKMTSAPWMPASQSMFLVRHAFIPTFVSKYLSLGGERDRHNLGEAKFVKLEQMFGPHKIKRLSVGCDRERPIPWDDPVWYCQQWTTAELEEAKRRNLI